MNDDAGPTPQQRDARLRLSRGLRVGLVSAGVVGSLGVAGVVAATAATAGQGQGASPGKASGFSQWRSDDGQGQDDGGASSADPWGQVQPPDLQQGGGQAHGSTGGS